MEHRYYTRIHAPLSVTISTHEGISLRGVIHNISYGGFLIELSDPAAHQCNSGIAKTKLLSKNNIAWAAFEEEHFSTTLPVMVVRRSNKTLALMFISHTPAFRPFINQLNALGDAGYKAACN